MPAAAWTDRPSCEPRRGSSVRPPGFQERRVKVSIVVPVYNEVESVPHLHRAIREAMAGRDHEVVYVDDGSTDGSVEELDRLVRQDGGLSRLIVLRRNFGQEAALAAGIDHSVGEVLVTLD